MITSTGNNFGAGQISFKDYQCERLVVLNGKFSFNNKSEAFKSASVLEVYLPELSIPRSGMSGCYITFEVDGKFYCTTIKTWQKNPTTICFEKLDYWSDQTDEYTIYVLSMYVPKGQRGIFEFGDKVRLTLTNTTSDNRYDYYSTCYIEENWCMIGMNTGSFDTEIDPFDDIVNLEGFPTDVDIELPFVGDNINSIQTYGSDMLEATIKNAVLTVKNIKFGWGGMPKEHFFYAICVRDKSIVTE